MLSFVAGLSFDSRCERSLSTAEVVVFVRPGPFFVWLVLLWFAFRRNANLAGGFAGRRMLWFWSCLFWLVPLFVDFCEPRACVVHAPNSTNPMVEPSEQSEG